jgi:hypothetical protein
MRTTYFIVLIIMTTFNLKAETVSKSVEYKQGDTVLEGYRFRMMRPKASGLGY